MKGFVLESRANYRVDEGMVILTGARVEIERCRFR